MLNRRHLALLLVLTLSQSVHARDLPVPWGNDLWRLQMDPATGAIVHIENPADPLHMNWLRSAGHWERTKWTPDNAPEAVPVEGFWGLVETSQTGALHAPELRKISDTAWEAVYVGSSLTVTIRRELAADGTLSETYAFKNTSALALDFPLGSIAIAAPLFDQYPDAQRSLSDRCHVHIWAGGSSAWINATRMSGEGPHLGLVLTAGSLDAYSQRGGTISDRGTLLLHPGAMTIPRGETRTLAWKLFWHKGWDDFFAKLAATEGFVRLSAARYTVTAGEPLAFTADAATPLEKAQLLVNGRPVPFHISGNHLTADIPTDKPGELLVELVANNRTSRLRANAIAPADALLDARIRFIVKNQQRIAPGDPLDGAYLAFDNDTGKQIYDTSNDHNAGRERMAMGVLGALYLPLCKDDAFKADLQASLARYAAFVARELEDDTGVVYNNIGHQKYERLYNYPWAAQLHLDLYRATGDTQQLDRAVRVLRMFYQRGGTRYYAIGIPVVAILSALDDAKRPDEKAELLALFRAHADVIAKNGRNYPPFEVNYEQSIVAPAVQLLTEVYLATGDKAYLDAAGQQMPFLEAFAGRQPDFHLYEVPLRHWDDYWFGKLKLYGDTMPHYWSTLNATAYAYYAKATRDPSWLPRADAILAANLSLFTPDGRASCAHLYPLTSNARPAAQNDPWANDQDWALVNLLTVRTIPKP